MVNKNIGAMNLNEDEVFLCSKCYKNTCDGAYGKQIIPLASIDLSIFKKNLK